MIDKSPKKASNSRQLNKSYKQFSRSVLKVSSIIYCNASYLRSQVDSTMASLERVLEAFLSDNR